MEVLFEQNQARATGKQQKQERSGSFFGLLRRGAKMVEEKKQTPNRRERNTMRVSRGPESAEKPNINTSLDTERHKQSIMTRIYIAQQKLHEINLGEALQEAD